MEIDQTPLEYILVVSTRPNKTRSTLINEIIFPPTGKSLVISGDGKGSLLKQLAARYNLHHDGLAQDPYLSFRPVIKEIYDPTTPDYRTLNNYFSGRQRRNRGYLFYLIDGLNPTLQIAGWQIDLQFRNTEWFMSLCKNID